MEDCHYGHQLFVFYRISPSLKHIFYICIHNNEEEECELDKIKMAETILMAITALVGVAMNVIKFIKQVSKFKTQPA